MRRKDRAQLRLEGEPVVVIDFRGMFVALAYVRVGAQLPAGDPYAIPGLERWRKGMKLLVNASLFRDGPMMRAPRESRKRLPPKVSVLDLMTRFTAQHPAIAGLVGTAAGHGLMFDESEVLVRALLRLRGLGILGLPLHDAIIAPRSACETVKQVMVDEYRLRTGRTIEVEEE